MNMRKAGPDVGEDKRAQLGLLNGLFIGLTLAIGLWGGDVVTLANLPVRLALQPLLIGAILVTFLTGFVGWLTARLSRTLVTTVLWLLAAVVIALLVAYLPSYGRTLLVWLADRRFWGLLVYPPLSGATVAYLIGGFFLYLLLPMLGALQDYRLDGIQGALGDAGRLSAPAIIRLLVPFPLVVLMGVLTAELLGGRSTEPLRLVHQAVQGATGYEGDLFALSREQGLNYNALRGVRDQLSDRYTLILGEQDPQNETVYIVVHFDNGYWIMCRVISDQLSSCSDASPPYTTGLIHLLTGTGLPEDCPACLPRVDEEWQAWLQTRGAMLDDRPEVFRLAQWGRYVLMRVRSADGTVTIDCRFSGVYVVQLDQCYLPADSG